MSDHEQIVAAYQQAGQDGDPKAYFRLAQYYSQLGMTAGTARSLKRQLQNTRRQMIKYYRLAGEAGYMKAYFYLSEHYRYRKQINMARLALDQIDAVRYPHVFYYLAQLYWRKDPDLYMSYIHQGADVGEINCLIDLAEHYYSEAEYESGEETYRQAIARGSLTALDNLLYKLKYSEDYDVELLTLAVDRGLTSWLDELDEYMADEDIPTLIGYVQKYNRVSFIPDLLEKNPFTDELIHLTLLLPDKELKQAIRYIKHLYLNHLRLELFSRPTYVQKYLNRDTWGLIKIYLS